MISHFKTLPNQITGVRLLLIPVIWGCILMRELHLAAGGMTIALISDAFDGYAARRLNLESEFGARLDSLTDNLLRPSAIIWVCLLWPDLLVEQLPLVLITVGIYLLGLLVGWVRFRQFGGLHLYSSKASGLVEYLFIIAALLSGSYDQRLLYLAMGTRCIASMEAIIIFLASSQVHEHLGSLVLMLLERYRPEAARKIRALLKTTYLV